MSRAFQCDICKSLYCNKKNKDTDSYFNPKVFKLRNKEVSLYEYNENFCSKELVDICPNCIKRIQDTINDILRERKMYY